MSYTNTLRARGGCQGQGLRLFVFFREKERQERRRGHWKVFLFLPDNILWQVLREEAAGKGAQEVRMKAVWLWVFRLDGGGVGRAVGRGNTLAHCRIMPLKNSFISCLLFTTKQRAAVALPPSVPLSLPSFFLPPRPLPGSHNTL